MAKEEHFMDCHSTKDNMVPELFFADPFVKGGWFVFASPERLFPWRTLYATYTGMEPSSLHSSKLKALRWVEKEIQKRLAHKKEDCQNGQFYKAQWQNDPEPPSQTLARLTYDWEPLNAALEKVR